MKKKVRIMPYEAEHLCRDDCCRGEVGDTGGADPPGLVDSSSEEEPSVPAELNNPEIELDPSSDEEPEEVWLEELRQKRWFGRRTSPNITETTARELLRPYSIESAAMEVLRTMQQDQSEFDMNNDNTALGSVGRLRVNTDDGCCEGTINTTRFRQPLHAETRKASTNDGVQCGGLDFRRPIRRDLSVMTVKNAPAISAVQPREDEWIQVEVTVDFGACVTVMPAGLCTGIPIIDNIFSKSGVEYEVANGESIPNLGERRCEIMTVGSLVPKRIIFQIADVHKPLLSITACSDMGFDCYLGKEGGSLRDRVAGETIPLDRQGSLYTLKMWVRQDQGHKPDSGFSRPE